MGFMFDFLPIILFFITFKVWGIYAATATAMLATLFQLFWSKFRHGKVKKTFWISFVAIFVLGGATLIFKNEIFIKWKPTIVYMALAIAMVVSPIVTDKTLLQHLSNLDSQNGMNLPELAWKRLNYYWAIFSVVMALTNLYVVYNFDTQTWNNFKLFGILGATLLFVIMQAMLMVRWSKPEKNGDLS